MYPVSRHFTSVVSHFRGCSPGVHSRPSHGSEPRGMKVDAHLGRKSVDDPIRLRVFLHDAAVDVKIVRPPPPLGERGVLAEDIEVDAWERSI